MSEPQTPPPNPGIDRLPGRLVVIALINLYLGFFFIGVGLGLGSSVWGYLVMLLGKLCRFSILPLIIIAIVIQRSAPKRPRRYDF